MTDRPLVIITTELPPAMCGIGTYSWLLRTYLPNEFSRVEFLVNKKTPDAEITPRGDRVTAFDGSPKKLAAALAQAGAANVLLHYAGRAYQRFGAPAWMPRVFVDWKRKFPDSRLIVVVHELPAKFPIASRHFWLGKISERVVARLAHSADVLVTNSAHHVKRLRAITGREDVRFLANASNIESAVAPGTPRVRTEFVVFGLPFGRWQTLELFQGRIRQWSAAGLLTKLHLIGPTDGVFAAKAAELIDDAIVVRHGEISSDKIGSLLRRVGFALTNASEETWSKSTTFMACVANECPIVVASSRSGSGPFSNTVGTDEVATISETELAHRTKALADWYRAEADWPIVASRLTAFGLTRPK
ncbi:MAG: hypothetical protein M3119_10455 [Verrucomicrobiota bacterium]|nr:hypothetical protein [Verrucomicrobiota bacterium]